MAAQANYLLALTEAERWPMAARQAIKSASRPYDLEGSRIDRGSKHASGQNLVEILASDQ